MKKDLYLTKDHEWIEYRGTVAYTGICAVKLKGIKKIKEIKFMQVGEFRSQGELLAKIIYDDREIDFSMPAHGRVISINELVSGDNGLLLEQPEGNGWIALIAPTHPYERNNLILPMQLQLNGKGKYAK